MDSDHKRELEAALKCYREQAVDYLLAHELNRAMRASAAADKIEARIKEMDDA